MNNVSKNGNISSFENLEIQNESWPPYWILSFVIYALDNSTLDTQENKPKWGDATC